jgi:hypothetical protein
MISVGEGWHNYHHAFPWDYRASELGMPYNLTTKFLDFLSRHGQVYDLKEATANMVKNRIMRTGDNTHHVFGSEDARKNFTTLWGIWRHPTNPTYNVVYTPPPKTLQDEGYALGEEELQQCEKDDAYLEKENEALMKKKIEEENRESEATQIYAKLSKYIKDQDGAQDTIMDNNNVFQKSHLNVDLAGTSSGVMQRKNVQ